MSPFPEKKNKTHFDEDKCTEICCESSFSWYLPQIATKNKWVDYVKLCYR